MKVSNAATSQAWKLLKLSISLFRRSFNASKCKTAAKMAVARIKLLRNKREVVVKQMRRDIALLLQSGQDATARIRVEHVIREQNVLAANELIELFCELVVARLSIIDKQRECPADLKEGIASVIFAAPRCSEIPELVALRDVFEKKYGKDFVSAATDLRPSCGVNRMLIDKLSVRTPTGEVKLKIMKEIAKEYEIQWDVTESEKELLKPPEELIQGPKTFVSATSMPARAAPVQSIELNKSQTSRTNGSMQFEDTASAAEAAAKSAKEAIAAAQAAAYLAKKDLNHVSPSTSYFDSTYSNTSTNHETRNFQNMDQAPKRMYESRSFNRSHYPDVETDIGHLDSENIYRRHSCNVPIANSDLKFKQSSNNDSDIKFDESDCDEEIDAETPPGDFCLPPERPVPPPPPSSQPGKDQGPRVHPKLPDYDTLAARFEALKYHKSQTQKKY